MKKMMVIGLIIAVFAVFTGCDDDSDPPPVFNNGLMAKIGDKDISASRNVQCEVKAFAGYEVIEFKAYTSKDEEWFVKFRLDDPEAKTVKISDNSVNFIKFDSQDIGSYSVEYSSDLADQTVIDILKYENGEIIEALFEGFIYQAGGGVAADSLNNGYFTTKTFVVPE